MQEQTGTLTASHLCFPSDITPRRIQAIRRGRNTPPRSSPGCLAFCTKPYFCFSLNFDVALRTHSQVVSAAGSSSQKGSCCRSRVLKDSVRLRFSQVAEERWLCLLIDPVRSGESCNEKPVAPLSQKFNTDDLHLCTKLYRTGGGS